MKVKNVSQRTFEIDRKDHKVATYLYPDSEMDIEDKKAAVLLKNYPKEIIKAGAKNES